MTSMSSRSPDGITSSSISPRLSPFGVADSRADELARAQILPFQVLLVAQRLRELVRTFGPCGALRACSAPRQHIAAASAAYLYSCFICFLPCITFDDIEQQNSYQT